MCADPFTLLTIASTGLSAVGGVVSGMQQQQMANAQAQAYEQQARAEAQASAYEAQREKHRQELAAAAARAQVGASGVALQGSPTEVLVANARENQLDLEAIKYGSQLRQNSLTTQAGISRYSGKQAMAGGIINAGSSLISGVSSLYDPNKSVRFGRSAFA